MLRIYANRVNENSKVFWEIRQGRKVRQVQANVNALVICRICLIWHKSFPDNNIVAHMETKNENNNKSNASKAKRDPRLVTLGRVLKQARETRSLTQQDMAGLIDSGQNEISRIENGALNYSVLKLMDISATLGGAEIELRVTPLESDGNIERHEYSFVVMQDFGGYNTQITELKTIVRTLEDGSVVEEEPIQNPSTVKEDDILREEALRKRAERKTL